MTQYPVPTIEEILQAVPDEEGRQLVRRAYDLAAQAHSGQVRESGEPYITHPLSVAGLLADLRMDSETLAAGLLHDVVEDSHVPLAEIEATFGPAVAQLVDGMTKLSGIKRLGRLESERNERDLENLRKSFLAMARDVRVMLIKLADRLHNMRTLDGLKERWRQERMVRETYEIYAPLANRLGIWQWKGELEDLAFRFTNPETYHAIAQSLEAQRTEREAQIERHIAALQPLLRLEGIDARIYGRPKHIYSIYRKMQRKQVPLEYIYDIQAMRIIVDTIADCYHVLGILHGLWPPIPGEFDDYIATPKENMYQSLHTAVTGLNNKTLEVQIRTHYMHQIAEYGIAAHWRYKEGTRRDRYFEAGIAALRAQIEARSDTEDTETFVQDVKADLLQERVYVFTPKGKVIELPAGSTPVDFAYHVHTDIGHRCRGAEVNGRWVPLDYVLQTGDQVRIITAKQKKAGPSRDWLNPDLGYVRTSRAKGKIRQWFRWQDREQNIVLGRSILERTLKRLGLAHLSHEEVALLFDYDDLEEFLARIGFGDINSRQIASKIAEEERKKQQEQEEKKKEKEDEYGGLQELPLAPIPLEEPGEVHVLGTGGLLTRLARCCNPIPGEAIVGYVTRGRGITVHRRDCANITNIPDTERLIEVNWGAEARTFPIPVYIQVYDRPGLLHEITGILSKEGINIDSISLVKKQNVVNIFLVIQVTDVVQLGRVLDRIAQVRNVFEVRRQRT